MTTNLCPTPEAFDSASWSVHAPARATISANSTAAPDGSITAETMTATSGADKHGIHVTSTFTTLAFFSYTWSLHCKMLTARYGLISVTSIANSNAWFGVPFDLQTGSLSATQVGASGTVSAATIRPSVNGWLRISVTGTITALTDMYLNIQLSDIASPTLGAFGDYSFTAAGTEAYYIWGGQLELGNTATDYYPASNPPPRGLCLSNFGYRWAVGT